MPHNGEHRAGDAVRSGPKVGGLAMSPVPFDGVPNASARGTKSEVAHE